MTAKISTRILFLFLISSSFSQNNKQLTMGDIVPLVLEIKKSSTKNTYKITGTKYKTITLIDDKNLIPEDWTIIPYQRGLVFKNKVENLEIRLFAQMLVPYECLKDKSKNGKSIKGNNVTSIWIRNGNKTRIVDYASITFYINQDRKSIDVKIDYSDRVKYSFYLKAEDYKMPKF